MKSQGILFLHEGGHPEFVPSHTIGLFSAKFLSEISDIPVFMHHGTDALKSSRSNTKNQVRIMCERAQYPAKYGNCKQ